VLVRPKLAGVLDDEQARAMASGADDVLAGALIVDSLEAGLAGVHWSVALSAREREFGPPTLSPRAAAARLAGIAGAGDVALVFGNERVGLSNADVDRCSAIAHIPANPAYTSLNLAQAVQVLAYELRLALLAGDGGVTAAMGAADPVREASGIDGGDDVNGASGSAATLPAASDEIEGMLLHLENALIALDFFDPSQPKKLLPRLRRMFARTGLEREEVNILRGIAKHILLKVK
jgi:tRNA/rRNA methyltransferase